MFRQISSLVLQKFFPELNLVKSYYAHSANSKLISSDSVIDAKARLYGPCRILSSSIDAYTYVSENSFLQKVKVGKFCSIGPNLICGWGSHPLNGISTSPMFYSPKLQNGFALSTESKYIEVRPTSIGNDVFIGMNVSIIDGVSIGDGAVIGAGTVVSKDVPPYSVVVGSPMRILRYRFNDDQIASLLQIKWWNWPEHRLRLIEKMFFDIDGLIEVCNNKQYNC